MTVEQWLGKENEIALSIYNLKYKHDSENFEEFLERITNSNAKYKQMIREKKFLPGGRIMSNRGVSDRKLTTSNCYVLEAPEDNLDSINDTRKYLERTMSWGGGVGFDLSKIAPRGAKINNAAKYTTGVVSFMPQFANSSHLIGQHGRNGALMLSLSINHPDVEEFIKCKTDLNFCTGANISVRVTDKFMEAVKNNENWQLYFKRPETNEEIIKNVNARDLLKLIAEVNNDYGEPGMLFWDTVERENLLNEDPNFKYAGVNPCVTGDTKILLDQGYVYIEACVGEKVNVWNGEEFCEVEPMITGYDQDILQLEFTDGTIINCTPYHKFILADGRRVEAKDLTPKDQIAMWKKPNFIDLDLEEREDSSIEWLNSIFNGKSKHTFEGSCGATVKDYDPENTIECIKLTLNYYGGSASISYDSKGNKTTITIDPSTLDNLVKAGFKLDSNNTNNTSKEIPVYLKSKKPNGKADKVYCLTEEKNHSFVANGMLVGNCGEEPLPAGGACNLGSINLSEFVIDPFTPTARIDIDELKKVVCYAVSMLNEVLNETIDRHPLEIQRKNVNDWRQIGLGVMGVADMFIKMGVRYGSEEAKNILNTIFEVISTHAFMESCLLTSTYKTYPKFNKDAVRKSKYFEKLASSEKYGNEVRSLFEKYGLANSQLLTIAPTGSLSNLLGISGGIEPIFANSYTRTTKSLHGKDVDYKIYTPIVKQYMDKHGITDEKDLPDFFVTARDISYKKRIDMQSTAQNWIDGAISSTLNLPKESTTEDVMNAYIYAWEKGLKGCTVFRENCKRAAILNSSKPSTKAKELVGKKSTLTTGCGSLHLQVFFDVMTGEMKELYLSKGSKGGCNNFMIGLSRMMSLAARNGVSTAAIVDQLMSCGVCPSYNARTLIEQNTSKGSCCPVAVGYGIIQLQESMLDDIINVWSKAIIDIDVEAIKQKKKNLKDVFNSSKKANVIQKKEEIKLPVDNDMICPQCGDMLHFTNGCIECHCGYSRCG